MTEERALYILDHLFDLCVDTVGLNATLEELKINYNCELTEEEREYITRGYAK